MEDWRWINKWPMKQIPWLFRKKTDLMPYKTFFAIHPIGWKKRSFLFLHAWKCGRYFFLFSHSSAEPEDKRRIPQLVFLEGVGYTLFPMLLKKVEEKRRGHRKIKGEWVRECDDVLYIMWEWFCKKRETCSEDWNCNKFDPLLFLYEMSFFFCRK